MDGLALKSPNATPLTWGWLSLVEWLSMEHELQLMLVVVDEDIS